MRRFEIEFQMTKQGGFYITYAESLGYIKDGFWVTSDGEFTKASDCYAYILPHMINYILKLKQD